MNRRRNPTGRGIDDWKSAELMHDYGPFLTPPAGKGIRLLELGIHESASLHFLSDYFENAAIISSGCKPLIPFGQGLRGTVRRYSEADE
jgi:hypothetical protein